MEWVDMLWKVIKKTKLLNQLFCLKNEKVTTLDWVSPSSVIVADHILILLCWIFTCKWILVMAIDKCSVTALDLAQRLSGRGNCEPAWKFVGRRNRGLICRRLIAASGGEGLSFNPNLSYCLCELNWKTQHGNKPFGPESPWWPLITCSSQLYVLLLSYPHAAH